MKKMFRVSAVLAMAIAMMMSMTACGDDSSSSSKAAASSSAAASSAAESSSAAEESSAAESTAESTADDASSEAETPAADGEVDTAALTANAWTLGMLAKEDGTIVQIADYAAELGVEPESQMVTYAFSADGKAMCVQVGMGKLVGTYTIEGKKIITNINNVSSEFELEENDGTKVLTNEMPESEEYKGAIYVANTSVDLTTAFEEGEAAEGTEEGAEGTEEGAEGTEEGAEGTEEGAEDAEGTEEAAE
ncbi:hypothetical protein [Ruminococcus sp. NK3A76]|uniref:hypothetical protein n=1 Tax=Ruminococcus sp. NK3A76 TaxID=877411 RepID=UPI00068FEFDF|nr:hypothetical protein [Ruminococcus sp. NK3A76]